MTFLKVERISTPWERIFLAGDVEQKLRSHISLPHLPSGLLKAPWIGSVHPESAVDLHVPKLLLSFTNKILPTRLYLPK